MISKADQMREDLEWLNEDIVFYRENIERLQEKKLSFSETDPAQEVLDYLIWSDTAILKEKEQKRAELL